MTTKYIVNGATSANINGPINGVGTYRALLSQTGSAVLYNLGDAYGGLIIGETYTITSYVSGDDFANVADVQSGDINTTGCVFIAIGSVPSNWSHYTELTSAGDMVSHVIENTLPFDIDWANSPFGGSGYYVAVTSGGPVISSFPKNSTLIRVQNSYPFNWSVPGGGLAPLLTPIVASFYSPDDMIIVYAWNGYSDTSYPDALYFTQIEINIKY
jgi:hypothetical protein